MDLLIVGGSTHGLTSRVVAQRLSKYASILFCDDRGPEQLPLSVKNNYWGNTGDLDALSGHSLEIFVAIGNNHHRRRITEKLCSIGLSHSLATLVDPQAILLGDNEIGSGSLIMPGAVIGPGVRLGASVVIGAHAFVGAASSIGSFSNICPATCIGAAASIGEETYIGMGARLLQGLSIAAMATVGAGAVVTKSIACPGKFAGIPARKLASKSCD
jgi:sugar O-acyltransferase (sialic acid O-acetyltransferase NeuD family)